MPALDRLALDPLAGAAIPPASLNLLVGGRPAAGCTLTAFTGTEGFSEVPAYRLTLACDGGAVPPGPGASVVFGTARRMIAGVVARSGRDGPGAWLEVRHAAGALTLAAHYRAWQGEALPETLRRVVEAHGVACDARSCLADAYAPRPLTVQYGSDDLTFVRARCEAGGLFFLARDDGSVLLGDSTALLAPGAPPVVLVDEPEPDRRLYSWQEVEGETPASAVARGHHPDRPAATWPLSAGPGARGAPGIHAGVIRSASRPEGEAELARRWESLAQAGRFALGASNAPLAPGVRVEVRGRRFLVTEVYHAASESGGWQNTFVALPEGAPYRTPARTPRPAVAGVVPAVVVGPDGRPEPGASDARADRGGRVLMTFPWLDPGVPPIPIAVPGDLAGWFATPRVGASVLVAFEDGDPDRPRLVGLAPGRPALLPHDTEARPAVAALVVPSPRPGALAADHTVLAVDPGPDAGRRAVHFRAPGAVRAAAGGEVHQTVAGALRLKAGEWLANVTGRLLLHTAGVLTLKGRELLLEAEQAVTIRAGGSTIVLKGGNVWVNGQMVYLNCHGAPEPAAAEAPGDPSPPEF